MLFHSVVFFKFFLVVFSVSFVLNFLSQKKENEKIHQWNKYFLLGASYFFYCSWDWRFLGLLIISTLTAYFFGLLIGNQEASEKGKLNKKRLLFLGLSINLGILASFKYFNFFMESFNLFISPFDIKLPYIEIIFPLGISFYLFQSISYIMDVNLKWLKPSRNYFDIALYISFFPQLLAGPIVRAGYFLPQLLKPNTITLKNLSNGIQIFLYGLFLKVVIADNISIIIDPVFNDPSSYSQGVLWVSLMGYSAQIFSDFAGYSEMAIGLALVLGFKLPINFNNPYLAADMVDFWRRWHISLSEWFRDYLFTPLQFSALFFFSKKSLNSIQKISLNFIITMGLMGLWHGPNWHYVLFGVYHGVGLVVSHSLSFYFKPNPKKYEFFTWIKRAGTFFFVFCGWPLLRSENMSIAEDYYRIMFLGNITESMLTISIKDVLLLFSIIMCYQLVCFYKNTEKIIFENKLSSTLHTCALLQLILIFAPINHTSFVYFQF